MKNLPLPFETRVISGIEVNSYEVRLPHLPPEADGLRMLQISDLHRGCGNSDALIERMIDVVGELAPDLIALTGDFVDEKAADIRPVVEMLSKLPECQGMVGVLGNHDHRGDPGLLEKLLEESGVCMLHNRNVKLRCGIRFCGVDDMLEGQADFVAALDGIQADEAVIFLSHNPNGVMRLPANRDILCLAGHTHGGQIVLPFPSPYFVCRFHLRTRFVHGWYEYRGNRLYVNRGIGVTGIGRHGMRYKCMPEISIFKLTA
ncbi:MAG: metallophosphoesterase [Chthonomonadales bacterium]